MADFPIKNDGPIKQIAQNPGQNMSVVPEFVEDAFVDVRNVFSCFMESEQDRNISFQRCLNRFSCEGFLGVEITMESFLDKTLRELVQSENGDITIEQVERFAHVLRAFTEHAKRIQHCTE